MKIIFAGAVALFANAAAAHADGSSVVVDFAERALAKGYGSMCSLAMVPSTTDGYYPCIDFGRYRYVREYQKVSGYVVGKDKKPFKIMGGTAQDPRFTIGGPWEQDMPSRVVMFWNDIIEGGAEKAQSVMESTKEREEAEALIRSQMGESEQKPSAPVAEQKPSGPTLSKEEVLAKAARSEPERLDVDLEDIKSFLEEGNN